MLLEQFGTLVGVQSGHFVMDEAVGVRHADAGERIAQNGSRFGLLSRDAATK